jgi:DNA-binding protein YbaB
MIWELAAGLVVLVVLAAGAVVFISMNNAILGANTSHRDSETVADHKLPASREAVAETPEEAEEE